MLTLVSNSNMYSQFLLSLAFSASRGIQGKSRTRTRLHTSCYLEQNNQPLSKERLIVLYQWFSNFSVCQNHLEDLLKYRVLNATPMFLIQEVWGGAQESAFLTSFQAMLMLLIQGPYFD